MRFLFFLIAIAGLALAANGAPIPEDVQKDFAKGSIRTCLAKQRQVPLSKNLTESQLNEYCSCGAARVLRFLKMEDLEQMMQTKSNKHIIPVIEEAGNYCTDVLAKKWGYLK